MTWAEFLIRLFAFNRKEKNDWLKIHEVNKTIIRTSMLDGKDKKQMLREIDSVFGLKEEASKEGLDMLKKLREDYENGRIKR